MRAFLLLLAAVGTALADHRDVVWGTRKHFDRLVAAENGIVLVQFFAPWCGHSKRMAPEWEKAAGTLRDRAMLVKVDATKEQSLAKKYNIRSYPSVRAFIDGKLVDHFPATCKKAQCTVEWVEQNMQAHHGPQPSEVLEGTTENLDDLIHLPGLVVVKFYHPQTSNSKRFRPIYEEAANALKGRVTFVKVDVSKEPKILKGLNLKTPQLPVIHYYHHGKEKVEYNEGKTAAAIIAWAEQKLAEETREELAERDGKRA